MQDPISGYTPLHAAIAACRPGPSHHLRENNTADVQESARDTGSTKRVESAMETVRLLLESGAIWNELDLNNETPGCLARRLGLMNLYRLIVDAGEDAVGQPVANVLSNHDA